MKDKIPEIKKLVYQMPDEEVPQYKNIVMSTLKDLCHSLEYGDMKSPARKKIADKKFFMDTALYYINQRILEGRNENNI